MTINLRLIPILLFSILVEACSYREIPVDPDNLLGDDYRLFQKSPAWELAKAVEDGDTVRIGRILTENPSLINYQEPKFGQTLLMMTVRNQLEIGLHIFFSDSVRTNKKQRDSFLYLLKEGADVNIHDTYSGTTALMLSCNHYDYSPFFAKMLIKYGAKINEPDSKHQESALTNAISSGMPFVKLLVESGADVNNPRRGYFSPLGCAFALMQYEIALYLLKQGADYEEPLFYRFSGDETCASIPIYIWEEIETIKEQSTYHGELVKIEEFLRKHPISSKK